MNTSKKSFLENSPYQNARTSLSEPKPRRTRSTSSKSVSSSRPPRSSSASDIYGSTNKSSVRGKGSGSRRTSDRMGEYPSSRGPSAGSRSSSTNSRGSGSLSRRSPRPTSFPMDSKPPRRPSRVRPSSASNEPTRSLAEDAEILRRFKSLMQQGSDNNNNAPVVSDPYPNYQVDEIGNVIHQKGTNRPKSEVKVVVRRKRSLVNDGEEYENDELNQDNSDYLLEDEDYFEDNDSDKSDAQLQQHYLDEQDDYYADNGYGLNDNLEPSAQLEEDVNEDDEQEVAPVRKARTTRKTTSTSKASRSQKEVITSDEDDELLLDDSLNDAQPEEQVASNPTNLSGIDDNLLRAAAIVFAQDPVMGVSKEQSLALGITANVAESILQEQTPGKKKKKKNKPTPAQKAEAEAAAAAAAAQEAAAIVALSKHFSGRKISQAESSLQAVNRDNDESILKGYKTSPNMSSTQALLNKLAKTQAQLEKDDILPDSFNMNDGTEFDDSKFARAATEDFDDQENLSANTYSAQSVADIDSEFEDDEQILSPQVPNAVAKVATKSSTRASSKAAEKPASKAAPKKATRSSTAKSKEQTTVVETKSTILNGANDTAITIEVKRRTSKR